MSKNFGHERMLTCGDFDHQLTVTNVFSCDSKEIVFDDRTKGHDPEAAVIRSVSVEDGSVRLIYQNHTGARAAMATCHPTERKMVFIKALDHPEINGKYHLSCRQSAIISLDDPEDLVQVDARDMYAPYTPGALRGGSHVMVISKDGTYASATYDDAVLHQLGLTEDCAQGDANLRNVQVSILDRPVAVEDRPGNTSGTAFSYVVAKLNSDPRPGSDEIRTCEEETFIGEHGYIRADGTRKERALACIGLTVDKSGEPCQEVFICDLPEGELRDGEGPMCGTATRRPLPPAGCEIRRLTRLCDRKFPGIRGDRHWLRTTPDGAWICFFALDDDGILQLFKAETATGRVVQVSHNSWAAESQLNLSPDGQYVTYVAGQRLVRTHLEEGRTDVLTEPGQYAMKGGAVTYSPDGRHICYNRIVPIRGVERNQICLFTFDE